MLGAAAGRRAPDRASARVRFPAALDSLRRLAKQGGFGEEMVSRVHQLGTVDASGQAIRDLYIDLREKLARWSAITQQTAQARMGYVGQHLTSIVTGLPGGKYWRQRLRFGPS